MINSEIFIFVSIAHDLFISIKKNIRQMFILCPNPVFTLMWLLL